MKRDQARQFLALSELVQARRHLDYSVSTFRFLLSVFAFVLSAYRFPLSAPPWTCWSIKCSAAWTASS